MIDKLFEIPDIAFLVVATVITLSILILRLFFKSCVFLWRGTLISYIVFVIFICMGVLYEQSPLGDTHFYRMLFHTLSAILLVPAMLIYGLFPGAIKMCPSIFDEFAIYTTGFLFYAIVIWGIMKFAKRRKETKAAENK
jgi:hypothetical protein